MKKHIFLKNQSFIITDTNSKSCSPGKQHQRSQDLPSKISGLIENRDEVGEDIPWSQPTEEDKEKHQLDTYLEKAKKATTKQRWGPVIPSRRSSRLMDNGRTVIANAQEFKRKWNLEDNPGKNKKPLNSHVVSKEQLITVAKDIGIGIEDGNPILDKMIELDSSRIADMKSRCTNSGCSSNSVETGLYDKDLHEKTENIIRTPNKNDQNGISNLNKERSEWYL
jgi:hypothetical protein